MSAINRENREGVIFENEGYKLFGVLHYPRLRKSELLPAVIIFHGFASHKIGKNRAYVRLAELLSTQGIAVLRFDARGCGDSQGSLSEMTIEGLVSDGCAAVSYLTSLPFINSKRIGFLGTSLGGAMAILTCSRLLSKSSIKALVLWAPVASGRLWYQDWQRRNPVLNSEKALATYQGISLHPLFREQFSNMKADSELEKLEHIPVLHFHGSKDEVVSLQHREAFLKKRNNAKAESSFSLVPDTDHFLGYSKHFPLILEQSAQWFTKHL